MKMLKLKWFLYFLGVRLAYRNRTSSSFQRTLADKKLVVQILVRDPALTYYFSFNDGQINSLMGEHPEPSLTLIFNDMRHASDILRYCLTDMPKLIQQMNRGSLIVQGDIGVLIWFSAVCEWALEKVTRLKTVREAA